MCRREARELGLASFYFGRELTPTWGREGLRPLGADLRRYLAYLSDVSSSKQSGRAALYSNDHERPLVHAQSSQFGSSGRITGHPEAIYKGAKAAPQHPSSGGPSLEKPLDRASVFLTNWLSSRSRKLSPAHVPWTQNILTSD